uniref:Major facilitator superfamily (MFS) profile domain-containing protein n=1 Tax=Leersia perrieri TaxID=77586 RepID=A0A0D9XZS9_9ORYZ
MAHKNGDADVEAPLLAAAASDDDNPSSSAAAGSSFALACTLAASLASIIYGYNRGVMSGAQKFVQSDLGITDAQIEVLIGATSIYSLISPPASRGFLSSIPEIAGNSGILLSYIADFALAGFPPSLNWRLMIGIGAVPPLFLAAAAILAMPETPRWLVLHGHHDAALRVLLRTTSGDSPLAHLRLHQIISSAKASTSPSPSSSPWRDIATPSVRRVAVAILGLQFFQQACGVSALVLYAPRVFHLAGVTSESGELAATALLGLTKTAAIVIPLFLADRLGRRPMLLTSAAAMSLSLLALAASFSLGLSSSISVAAAAAFMAAFSVGFGPVIWMYGSEILPLRLRAQGTGIGTAANRVMSAVVGMSFISVYEAIGMAATFYLFAAFAAAAWVFVYAFLPETKGRSLEEMEALFADKPPATATAAAT